MWTLRARPHANSQPQPYQSPVFEYEGDVMESQLKNPNKISEMA
jgi:hypothetical protein